MPWPRLLADAIVIFHAAYVAFVVLGMAAIVLGVARGWAWVENVWFRAIHAGAIGIVVLESAVGVACPLTTWERRLRQLAGQESDPGDFIGHWAHRLIFVRAEPWVFSLAYGVFGAAVLLVFVLRPPRRRCRGATPSGVADSPAPRCNGSSHED